jgi:hypothetical protein
MALVGSFIGIAILLAIGTQILGNTVQDCSNIADFDTSLTTQADGTWAAACESQNAQTQNAYALLMIVLIVVAAVVILTVVRLL